jgi:hypothetical protein
MFNRREKQLQRLVQGLLKAMALNSPPETIDALCNFLSREDLEMLIEGITDLAGALGAEVTIFYEEQKAQQSSKLYNLAMELNNRLKQ